MPVSIKLAQQTFADNLQLCAITKRDCLTCVVSSGAWDRSESCQPQGRKSMPPWAYYATHPWMALFIVRSENMTNM